MDCSADRACSNGRWNRIGAPIHRMLTSGAGHDAMVLAPRMPVAMLFLRSPGGISHHPDEAVARGGRGGGAGARAVRFLDLLAAERP